MKKLIIALIVLFLAVPCYADLTLTAVEGIDIVKSGIGGTVTVSGEDASDTNKGIASFVSTYFTVSSGAVSLKAGTLTNGKGCYWSTTSGLVCDQTYLTAESDPSVDSSAKIQAIIGAGVYLAAGDVALGSGTSGNYVSSATANGGLTLTGTEGASLGITPCTGNENYIMKWNAATGWTCQADATGAGGSASDSDWTLHNSFPSACSAGSYVSAIGDTLTCANPITGVVEKVEFIISGNGSVVSAGASGNKVVPFAGTVTKWEITSSASGSMVVDVKKATYADMTFASIAGTEKPTITTSTKGTDTNLTTWTTSVSAGDRLQAVVDSADITGTAVLTIYITRS